MNLPDQLLHTFQSTGFMSGNTPVPGLAIDRPGLNPGIDLCPDAVWRDQSQLAIVFKYTSGEPSGPQVAAWHRDVWNLGIAPLLWVVSPQSIRIYNAYQRPVGMDDAKEHLLQTVQFVDEELARLDDYAGHLAMTSGRFWSSERRVRRDGRVDLQLLRDLQNVEQELCVAGLPTDVAQGLLGRSIFVRYLADRRIVGSDFMRELCGCDLRTALGQREQAYRLFDWVRSTFNGDLFPITQVERGTVKDKHLKLVSETLAGVDPATGQGTLWPYRFDVIPIEFISSIYEQFTYAAQDAKAVRASREGVHYTPVSVVNLILDQVIADSDKNATVLDISCGSGVFLVEALRRLVAVKDSSTKPSRALIRETLHRQIFGVDKSEPAIRIASFSLYLAAIELDPDPTPPKALRFDPLVGRNLFVGDAFEFDSHGEGRNLARKKFDIIVGNPPWTYGGKSSKGKWSGERQPPPVPPRSQDFAFVWRSMDFAHSRTRFGVVMRATPFFARFEPTIRARDALLKALSPVALVNLAALRRELFPTATHPAIILLARLRLRSEQNGIPIVTVPWTSRFSRSGTFEIAPSDVRTARISEESDSSQPLKATALGSPRDRLLLRRMEASATTLDSLLRALGTKLVAGIQEHLGDRKDASDLRDLPLLRSGSLKPCIKTRSLPRFDHETIHRTRTRDAFHGPLVLIGEGLRHARLSVGVSEPDLVYTGAYYGISFADITDERLELAMRLGGILPSSVVAWHAFLTASEFGIHKRRLLRVDVINLPTPSLDVLRSADAAPIANATRALGDSRVLDSGLLAVLDKAVFDLYGLNPHERLVVKDGVERAKREYQGAREEAEAATSTGQLETYARQFLSVINAWQRALNRPSFGAQIVRLRQESPIRVVWFQRVGTEVVDREEPESDLNTFLDRIGKRIRLNIRERLALVRELRVHAGNDLLVIKPSSRRYWTPATGLNDADRALGDGLRGDPR